MRTGFDMYICQKCNMNEFAANLNKNDNTLRKTGSEGHSLPDLRNDSHNFSQQSFRRSTSSPRPPPMMRPKKTRISTTIEANFSSALPSHWCTHRMFLSYCSV